MFPSFDLLHLIISIEILEMHQWSNLLISVEILELH